MQPLDVHSWALTSSFFTDLIVVSIQNTLNLTNAIKQLYISLNYKNH